MTTILARLPIAALLLGLSTTLASCQRNHETLDSQAFALILDDLKTLAHATPEVNPGGLSKTVAAADVTARTAFLEKLKLKVVADVGNRGCPGITAYHFPGEKMSDLCPKSLTSVVIVNHLVVGLGDGEFALGNLGLAQPRNPYSIMVNVFELSPMGSELNEYAYIMNVENGKVSLYKRVMVGMS